MFVVMNSFPTKNKKTAPAVGRAFAILRLLSQTKEPQGVTALARALGIAKSSTHALLEALLATGAIEHAGKRQFRLGPLVEELGRSRHGNRKLTEICQPYLLELAEQLGQTSVFGVPIGDRFRIVSVVEGRGLFRVKAVQDRSIPLLAGVVGKIALAWEILPVPQVLPGFTKDSVGDVSALGDELARVRSELLALDRGEYPAGGLCCRIADPEWRPSSRHCLLCWFSRPSGRRRSHITGPGSGAGSAGRVERIVGMER